MTRCISCASQIPDTSRFCLACDLGYTAKLAGAAHGFAYDRDYFQYVERTGKSPTRWKPGVRRGRECPPHSPFVTVLCEPH